jgi:hypothetical protein
LNQKANIRFSIEKEMKIELGTGFFIHKRIISAVKKVEFVSNRMSYIILWHVSPMRDG